MASVPAGAESEGAGADAIGAGGEPVAPREHPTGSERATSTAKTRRIVASSSRIDARIDARVARAHVTPSSLFIEASSAGVNGY